ncbi:MAG: MotA/TolQ/ExbB proton channel family protein, partial [Candidatus Latescibacteria bacterium]|nr:MotA/TolQ/ExbB proton channel family protein [Candidatus Latescibacterota bacterium]
MVQLFNDGGWAMYPIAFLLVFGVAIALERLYTLSQAAIDASGFFQQLEEALRNGGAKQAAELCSETRGPVASVIHAGLLRMHRGVDNVEKTIENAGAVQMAFLERGMVWL